MGLRGCALQTGDLLDEVLGNVFLCCTLVLLNFAIELLSLFCHNFRKTKKFINTSLHYATVPNLTGEFAAYISHISAFVSW